MFIAAIFMVPKKWKQPVSFDRWLHKDGVHICDGILLNSAIRKDQIPSFATTWMKLQNVLLSEISQEKLKTMWFHTYVGYRSETHRHRQRLKVIRRKGSQGVLKGKGGQMYSDGRWSDSR